MLQIYTDGSCRRNGAKTAKGGFGVVVVQNGEVINTYAEQHEGTTNNQMEMSAILWAIVTYREEIATRDVIIFSDSMYAVNTFTQWMWGWKTKGWSRGKGKRVENLTFVKFYDKITDEGKLPVQLEYVRGHAGNKFNEMADSLATGELAPQTTKGEKLEIGIEKE